MNSPELQEHDPDLAYINAPFDAAEIEHDDADGEWLPSAEPPVRVTSKDRYSFGHPHNVKVGDLFASKKDLHNAGVHTGFRAGIHGRRDEGAYSIVLSGRYEDDSDKGETIPARRSFYTGTGGQSVSGEGGPQVQHQSFTHNSNKALLTSMYTGNPVRVSRGHELRSKYAPREGFRYDGLYKVVNASMKTGKSGFDVCVFELRRIPGQPPIPILGVSAADIRPARGPHLLVV
ncbi:PUA-like domain-containing protein [Trametes polyzona]|nr:PUA-like domain-containing protein [Trametes polyzona]